LDIKKNSFFEQYFEMFLFVNVLSVWTIFRNVPVCQCIIRFEQYLEMFLFVNVLSVWTISKKMINFLKQVHNMSFYSKPTGFLNYLERHVRFTLVHFTPDLNNNVEDIIVFLAWKYLIRTISFSVFESKLR